MWTHFCCCKCLYLLNLARRTPRVVFLVINYYKMISLSKLSRFQFDQIWCIKLRWTNVDLGLNNGSSSNFWPSKTSTLPSPPARGAPYPPCSSFRFISTSGVPSSVSSLFHYCIISLSISTSGVRNSASFIFCYCIISLVFEETVSQANSLSPNDKTRLLSA